MKTLENTINISSSAKEQTGRFWQVYVKTHCAEILSDDEVCDIIEGVCDCDSLKDPTECRMATSGSHTDYNTKSVHINFLFSYLQSMYSKEEAIEYAKLDTKRCYRKARNGLNYDIDGLYIDDENGKNEVLVYRNENMPHKIDF